MINVREKLQKVEYSDSDLETFLQQCDSTANALAADRSTRFLPIIVAQGFFVGSIAVAFAKLTASTSDPTVFINVEAHSIAFSALYFWILPAVFLASVIGVSQTKNAMPRILRNFQDGFDHTLREKGIKLPNDVLEDHRTRTVSGGIYSWQPDGKGTERPIQGVSVLQRVRSLLPRKLSPLAIVFAGTLTAWLVSSSVPPDGWEPRLCAQALILLAWLASFALTGLLKRNSSSPSYNDCGRFWLTFFKDLLATLMTMGTIVATQWGFFNQCDSYSRWNSVGLAIPGQPDVATTLAYRIKTLYPALIFTCIGLQMFVIPISIIICYQHAFLVFLQRDEENSSPLWFLEWPWPRRDRSPILNQHRMRCCDKTESLTIVAVPPSNDTQFVSDEKPLFEQVEL